jgi:hypothetical protein
MKRIDWVVLGVVVIVLLPFFLSKSVYQGYEDFNGDHGMITSFVKFAILATFGEALGLRIRTGQYNQPGFGLLPRAIVWGFLGLTIKFAFVVFAVGTPSFLSYMGWSDAPSVMPQAFCFSKVLVALSISTAMNLIYAPVMMTLHKITDTHIISNGGTVKGLLRPIRFNEIVVNLNWNVQWNFVFKRTIPFFWIPAHTITFLLPADFQVLFAALLGVALGVILAIANQMSVK